MNSKKGVGSLSIILVVIIRSIISFFSLLIVVRLMGKQQMSELTFFDYIVGITIGSFAATLSVQVNQNTIATLAGIAIWTVLPILLAFLGVHNVWIRKTMEGEASIVIANGKILEKNLRKTRISIDNLISLLRNQGVFNVADVEFALFEPNGNLSILKKADKQPLTPGDISMPTQYDGLPTVLISDGKLLTSALYSLNLSKAWLMYQLKKQNIEDVSLVSLAQLDTKKNLYVDLKGDQPSYVISTED